jgi:vanillate O-demethylase monooxygenase subunit
MPTFTKRNYPLNCWWVAASAEEVTRKPLCRWLLEQRVVLYRTEEGAAVALEDRCAHRWAPLSQGKLIGDEIACPYHGFRYDTRGSCTHIPTQSQLPSRLKVRSYPVREQGSLVWIWMGDPTSADPALLPDIPWFTDPAYAQIRGYTEVNCNYMVIQENVLDLTHVAYLHADVQYEGWQGALPDVKATDRTVTFTLKVSDVSLAPVQATLMGVEEGERANRTDWGTFASPACTIIGNDIELSAPARRGPGSYNFRGLHCTTPISPHRCHYWWPAAQNYGQQLANFTEFLKPILENIIKQDTDLLEAIQTTIAQDRSGDDAPEFLVASDRAPVEARRILKSMLEAETQR